MTAALQQFRITADWKGGGFGYTKPFASEYEALEWGRARALFHPDAVVSVTPREEIEPVSVEQEMQAMRLNAGAMNSMEREA